MLKLAPHVLDDDTSDDITVQLHSCVSVESDSVILQYLDNAIVMLSTAMLPILMTAPLVAVLMQVCS